ncbi:MAG: chaperone NapD [Betaproteobacteria bacterium]|nr:chaperone NapD [Betaproteobacteria bacterium]
MNITGILVHARPGEAEAARDQLQKLPGVEVHAVTPEGRLIVTVERPDERGMALAFDRFSRIPEIVSTVLVYNHFDGPDSDSTS